jgi:5-formyltetrahydrofolate cyclo-ligase
LFQLPVWRRSRGVLAFHPLDGEPDLRPVLETALRQGKVLALPRFQPAAGIYGAARVSNLDADLVTGRFGVLEPRPECPEATTNQLDLALIPGVGFDLTGGRLGRGGGFYDRLLRGWPGTLTCGVAFDWQLAVAIPMDPHDVAMDSLLTPGDWRSFQPGEGGQLE